MILKKKKRKLAVDVQSFQVDKEYLPRQNILTHKANLNNTLKSYEVCSLVYARIRLEINNGNITGKLQSMWKLNKILQISLLKEKNQKIT
jgi:hypothetical protein